VHCAWKIGNIGNIVVHQQLNRQQTRQQTRNIGYTVVTQQLNRKNDGIVVPGSARRCPAEADSRL
jgi:hypothetical protein